MLGDAGSQITMQAKKGEIEAFSVSVDVVANAVCQLTEASAQAAYLVGIADPSSTAAVPGLIDQAQFARASQVRRGGGGGGVKGRGRRIELEGRGRRWANGARVRGGRG